MDRQCWVTIELDDSICVVQSRKEDRRKKRGREERRRGEEEREEEERERRKGERRKGDGLGGMVRLSGVRGRYSSICMDG